MTDLKSGDKVRLTHAESGSVIESEVRRGGFTGTVYINVPGWPTGTMYAESWQERGWTIEKIAPPLPTEPGVYVGERWKPYPQRFLFYILELDGTWKLHWSGGEIEVVDAPSGVDLPLVPMVKAVSEE